jgi:hypothetical protein
MVVTGLLDGVLLRVIGARGHKSQGVFYKMTGLAFDNTVWHHSLKRLVVRQTQGIV